MSSTSRSTTAPRDAEVAVVARLPRTLGSVGTARDIVGGIVDAHGDEDGREVARLLVSEVVTNSVLHGGGERLTLHVRVEDDVVRVEVTDAGPGIPAGRDVAMPPPDSVTGRGLGILARSARRWGHRSAPARVWFELPCRGCEEPDRP